MTRRTRRGFTLLELLLVVGILVILAGLVSYNLIGQSDRAKIRIAEATVGPNGTLAMALKSYYADVGKYPSSEEGLEALRTKPSDEKVAAKWAGPYLEEGAELTDPWKMPYQYVCPGEHNKDRYDLSSAGPDMAHGTEDDIPNWSKETTAGG